MSSLRQVATTLVASLVIAITLGSVGWSVVILLEIAFVGAAPELISRLFACMIVIALASFYLKRLNAAEGTKR